MSSYYFEARKANGAKVTGYRNGNSEDHIATQLIQERLTPIKISISKKTAKHSKDSFDINHLFKAKKVPLEDLLMFCRQMYTMSKAGVPLIQGVIRISETSDNRLLKETLDDISEQLKSGKTLATAMQQHPAIFSTLFINVITVGEASGRLDKAFLSMIDYLQMENKTIKQFKAALRYPITVVIAVFAAMLIINVLVIPAFSNMFKSFGAELPLPTKILIATSNFIISNWVFLLLGSVILIIAIRMFLKTDKGKLWWSEHLLKIKIIGPILRRILLARFARTFGLITQAGVSIDEGLQMVGRSLGNAYMESKIDQIHQSIGRGETISRAAANSQLFTPLVLQMLAVGEETGTIDEMLTEVAEFYEQQADYDISRLGDAIEPILLVAMGLMVLVLALGVFLPMWDMVQFAK